MPPGKMTMKEAIITHRQQNALDTELYPHSISYSLLVFIRKLFRICYKFRSQNT